MSLSPSPWREHPESAILPPSKRGNANMAGKTVLYAAVGPDIALYDIDVATCELTKRGTASVRANVQYVWPHA